MFDVEAVDFVGEGVNHLLVWPVNERSLLQVGAQTRHGRGGAFIDSGWWGRWLHCSDHGQFGSVGECGGG